MSSANARSYRSTESGRCVTHSHEIIHQTKFKLDEKQLTEIADEMRRQQLMRLLSEDWIMRTTDLTDMARVTCRAFALTPKWNAAPQPYPPDLQHPALVMTCPNCGTAMRIRMIELRDGRERITLACEECGREVVLDSPSSRR